MSAQHLGSNLELLLFLDSHCAGYPVTGGLKFYHLIETGWFGPLGASANTKPISTPRSMGMHRQFLKKYPS